LPAGIVEEAENFRQWVVRAAVVTLLRKLGLLPRKEFTEEQYQNASSTLSHQRVDEVKAKVQFGLTDRVFVVCDALKRLWRNAHPRISSYWPELENAAKSAVFEPGKLFVARKVRFRRDGAWLRMGLPSGRVLCYPNPEVDRKTGTLSYMGLNQYSRKWERLDTYGGKLCENAVQAIACDQLSDCMPAIDAAGYPIVFHVHDEVACETPDTEEFTHGHLVEMMCADLGWNEGLPLAAAGFTTYRYRKD
jgi:DNA polymerase